MVLLNLLLGLAVVVFLALILSVISRINSLGQQLDRITANIREAEAKERKLSQASTLEEVANLK